MHLIKKNILKILFFLIMIALQGCAANCGKPIVVSTTNLWDLENLGPTQLRPVGTPELNQLRIKALEDTAMSLGAQGGLASASEEIDVHLTHDAKYLDTIYNFNGMMLSHGVIPPVLTEGDNSLNLADPNTIRIADKTYKIVQQARFATTPPNWHDYLWQSFAKPEVPANFLLPRNAAERCIWVKALTLGWENGIKQSYTIFRQNLARLKRDFKGMILYRKLLQEKMVSPPFVATTDLGITGSGEDMRINDKVLRIVELPKLQTDGTCWKAIVVKHDY